MSNSGYISLAIICGVITAIIVGGIYYARGDNNMIPIGMSNYGKIQQCDFTPHFGGKKTNI